ncbi:MAG: hypothetical protein JSU67_07545 [Gammaproteobacteria bacterium]|nr:MAG: hypothetical protein EP300_05475 [Gammaproteobacteria bacterium]UCH41507.1 MAG: hypothetical protein JSU67_07545 [Gammaproteobacteria bacterium]
MDGNSHPEMKNLPPVPSLPAFARLGMGGLEVKKIIEFLTRSRAEIHAIEAASRRHLIQVNCNPVR